MYLMQSVDLPALVNKKLFSFRNIDVCLVAVIGIVVNIVYK